MFIITFNLPSLPVTVNLMIHFPLYWELCTGPIVFLLHDSVLRVHK